MFSTNGGREGSCLEMTLFATLLGLSGGAHQCPALLGCWVRWRFGARRDLFECHYFAVLMAAPRAPLVVQYPPRLASLAKQPEGLPPSHCAPRTPLRRRGCLLTVAGNFLLPAGHRHLLAGADPDAEQRFPA